MKRIFTSLIVLAAAAVMQAANITVNVSNNRCQTITGFGAACSDGAMCPYGDDTTPVKLLYSRLKKIGLNIMRMEISPNFEGDIVIPEWNNYDTPYDWKGSLPSAQYVKKQGGIVFGTPWSPPGEYKTNGSAQGGKVNDNDINDPQNQRGKLRTDCYDKFFPWMNTFLAWMKDNGVEVDAVSVQNEPDWWVNYSGCLYTPQEQVNLVKNYAHMLDREKFPKVRLMSAEPLGFDPSYSNALLNDATARDQVDIIAGHIYGHPPLGNPSQGIPANMKNASTLASKYGKELWMTEHSATDHIDHLPTWHEQLIFAEEVNECMLAGCTGYIYWYMRAHWAFVGTGEPIEFEGKKITLKGNDKNTLLPRAYVMSHFSWNVTGSTRLRTSMDKTSGDGDNYEFSAYQKGDSLIVMAIDTTKYAHNLIINLPAKVKSGTHWLSTGNEQSKLCQKIAIDIAEPTDNITIEMPARSLNTYIFMIDKGSTAIENVQLTDLDDDSPKTYYDLQGRRLDEPAGLCIERSANGRSRKVMMNR